MTSEVDISPLDFNDTVFVKTAQFKQRLQHLEQMAVAILHGYRHIYLNKVSGENIYWPLNIFVNDII